MRAAVTAVVSTAMAFGLLLSTASTANANAMAGGGYSSSYAGESVFEGKAAGESGQFSAIFFNDGTQSWAPGVIGLLVCLPDKVSCNVASPNASYASGCYSSTVYATVSSTVAPGQNGFFVYNFAVPAGTAGGTVATFNGDVGLIATGAELRPEGYYQQNTTPAVAGTLTISPASASLALAAQQQFTATTNLTGTVTWSVTGGCGAITSSGLFVATATNSSSQPCSVVATAGSLTASAAITVYGAATQLTCTANPTTIVADGGGTNGTSTVTVSVKDANGNLVSNSSQSITITNATTSLATLSQSGAVSATNGTLSFTVSSTTTQGQIIIAASSGTSGITSCTVLITSGAAGTATQTASSFVDDPNCTTSCTSSPIAADNSSTSTLRVDIEDANGARTADSVTIDVTLTSGAGVCTIVGVVSPATGTYGGGSATATTVNGRVQFTVQSSYTPGTCTFLATPRTSGITSSSATLTTRIVGTATQLVVTKNTSPVAASASSVITVTVAVEDAVGDRISNSTATVTASLDSSSCTGAGGGNVTGTSSATASSGYATFTFTSAGAYSGCVVTFSSSGLSNATATIVYTPGSADHLGCVFTPTSIPANTSYTAVGLVTVRDVLGNVVNSGSYSVNFVYSSSDPHGGVATSLQTASPQTMTNGTAAFTVKATGTIGTDTYTPSIASGGTLSGTNTTCQIAAQ